MKRTNTIFFSALLLCGLLLAHHTTNAARLDSEKIKVQTFGAKLADDTSLELIYVAKTGKLGVVLKSAKGEPVGAQLLYGVKEMKDAFDMTGAKQYGKADEVAFTSIKVSNLTEESLDLEVKDASGGRTLKLARQDEYEMMESGLKCDNYCRPSDPNQFNWWLCFWCCSTASGPCV